MGIATLLAQNDDDATCSLTTPSNSFFFETHKANSHRLRLLPSSLTSSMSRNSIRDPAVLNSSAFTPSFSLKDERKKLTISLAGTVGYGSSSSSR